jgi:hypothetical protein
MPSSSSNSTLTFSGTDLVLMDTMLDILKEARLPTKLRTGKTML